MLLQREGSHERGFSILLYNSNNRRATLFDFFTYTIIFSISENQLISCEFLDFYLYLRDLITIIEYDF